MITCRVKKHLKSCISSVAIVVIVFSLIGCDMGASDSNNGSEVSPEILGMRETYNLRSDEKLLICFQVKPNKERTVFLDQYVDGEWKNANSYELKRGEEEAKIDVPEQWKQQIYSTWRLRIPKTKHDGKTYREKKINFKIVASNVAAIDLHSRSAVIIDDDGNVVFEKNKDEKLPMASTTKLMTGLIAVEEGDLKNDILFTSEEAAIDYDKLGSRFVGYEINSGELLKAAMICSSNGAALAIAKDMCGTEESFVALMNERADELGLNNTRYVNVHGLDDLNQYSSAYDGALLMKEAYQEDSLKEILSTSMATIVSTNSEVEKRVETTNRMLGEIDGIEVAKTGWTENAGSCIIEAYSSDDKIYYICTLGSSGEKEYAKSMRDSDSKKLFEYIDTLTV